MKLAGVIDSHYMGTLNLFIHGLNIVPPPYFPLANLSSQRQLTEMSHYSMEIGCPKDSKKYRLISVGCRAEQFTIEIDQFYQKNSWRSAIFIRGPIHVFKKSKHVP